VVGTGGWFVAGIDGGFVVVGGLGAVVEWLGAEADGGGIGVAGGTLVAAAFGFSSVSVKAVRVERMDVWFCWILRNRWS
jgi:hypothetical protein